MLENRVEKHLTVVARRHGLLCMKFTSPSRGGVPDRLLVTPIGTIFIELKRPGEKPNARQLATHASLHRFGAEVHVLDSIEAIDQFIDELDLRIKTSGATSQAWSQAHCAPQPGRSAAIRQAARQALAKHSGNTIHGDLQDPEQ